MERKYAGSLATVALVTATVRGWASGGAIDEILWFAWAMMLAFAGLGFLLGAIAGRIVDESVRIRFAEELSASERSTTKRTTTAN